MVNAQGAQVSKGCNAQTMTLQKTVGFNSFLAGGRPLLFTIVFSAVGLTPNGASYGTRPTTIY